jgi:hypothetical protein
MWRVRHDPADWNGRPIMRFGARDRVAASFVVACLASGAFGCATTTGTTVSGTVGYRGEKARVAVVFSDHDRGLIRDYYGKHRKSLPPGLAKKEELPPGLKKQVQRNGHLPPGLEGDRLPRELEKQLAHLPEGHIRLRVGADIVLMDGKSRLILDVMKDVAL